MTNQTSWNQRAVITRHSFMDIRFTVSDLGRKLAVLCSFFASGSALFVTTSCFHSPVAEFFEYLNQPHSDSRPRNDNVAIHSGLRISTHFEFDLRGLKNHASRRLQTTNRRILHALKRSRRHRQPNLSAEALAAVPSLMRSFAVTSSCLRRRLRTRHRRRRRCRRVSLRLVRRRDAIAPPRRGSGPSPAAVQLALTPACKARR